MEKDCNDYINLAETIDRAMGTAHKFFYRTFSEENRADDSAKALSAYYSRSDTVDVIYVDAAECIPGAGEESGPDVVERIEKRLLACISGTDRNTTCTDGLYGSLYRHMEYSGKPYVFLIDNWDAVLHRCGTGSVSWSSYLYMLRGLFANGNFTPKAVAAVYMTGILSVKESGAEYFLPDFERV